MLKLGALRGQFFKKKKCPFLLASLFLIFLFQPCLAASLNEIYGSFLKKGDVLYETGFDYFRMEEKGRHAAPIYDDFNSRPSFYLLRNLLNFALIDNLEFTLGSREAVPTTYGRSIYDTAHNLSVIQEYDINYLRDYILGVRLRQGPMEFYLDILQNSQKDDWRAFSYPGAANYFSYIRAHYEDFSAGAKYLSKENEEEKSSNLSLLTRPLVALRQVLTNVKLSYRKAAMRMNAYNYVSSTFTNYYRRLTPHLSPSLLLNYGFSKAWELETGLIYTSPFKHKYEYRETVAVGADLLEGAYKINRNFQIPLTLRHRPKENVECKISSDLVFTEQRLDYYTRQTTGVITDYPPRELSYFNTRPTLALTYFYENNKKLKLDEFSQWTKKLLNKGQFLVELEYQKDITSLSKNANNGSQNIIDPYSLFIYPLDFFVAGSEYSAFYTGNSTRTAANVLSQNYYLLKIAFKYGLTDRFNAGLRFGYQSASRLHHFTLGNPNQAYDQKARYYQFKPYYFVDFLTDWRLTDNSLLSLACHIVPEYNTILKIDGLTKEFHENSKYMDLALRIKIIF
jgi:hypothetical protein